MPLKAGVIGRVYMRKIIGKEPATLIKTFASHGNIIKRRIDFQDDGKVMCGQHVQNSLAIAPVTKFGPDAQMLDIDQGVCLPKQGKANKGGRIKNKTEAVVLYARMLSCEARSRCSCTGKLLRYSSRACSYRGCVLLVIYSKCMTSGQSKAVGKGRFAT